MNDYVTKEEFSEFKDNHFAHFLVDFAVVKSQVADHRKLLWIIIGGIIGVLIKLFVN